GAIGLAGLQRFKEMTDHATLSSH
ncbi:MAG TPA: imidazole glycerol phosphate synthase subunit HisH, partial [Lactobacillus sp.]|nr:imidazole glycerol phosphate synthase subunit HisH [Lactobacillus sp.]